MDFILKNSARILLIYFIASLIALIFSWIINPLIWIIYNFIFTSGFLAGWVSYKVGNLYYRNKDFSTSDVTDTLMLKVFKTLRTIVIKNKEKNGSFICDITSQGKTLLQITNKAYFVDFQQDVNFGLVLYINHSWLGHKRVELLENTLAEELKSISDQVKCPEYSIVNLDQNIRFGMYIISLILKDVYSITSTDEIEIELLNENFALS